MSHLNVNIIAMFNFPCQNYLGPLEKKGKVGTMGTCSLCPLQKLVYSKSQRHSGFTFQNK